MEMLANVYVVVTNTNATLLRTAEPLSYFYFMDRESEFPEYG